MRFKSKDGSVVRVARLDGNVFIVGPEWRELPERFWQDAYANGCESEDQVTFKEINVNRKALDMMNRVATRKDEIKGIILSLVKEGDLSNFGKNDNKPRSAAITERAGYRVTNSERDEIWFNIQNEGLLD